MSHFLDALLVPQEMWKFQQLLRRYVAMQIHGKYLKKSCDSFNLLGSITNVSEGHCIFPLPFRVFTMLQNNRLQVEERLSKLKCKFEEDREYHKEYSRLTADLFNNHYPE